MRSNPIVRSVPPAASVPAAVPIRSRAPNDVLAVAFGMALSGCGFYGYDSLARDGGPDVPLDARFDASDASDATVDATLDASHDAAIDTGFDAALDCDSGACRRVFVTSAGLTASGFGGVMGADTFCQAAGTGAGLLGVYKAWLSDSTVSASSRLAHASVPYQLPDGTRVANDWNDLVDGALLHAIDVTEAGDALPAVTDVWTGTTTSGAYAGSSCTDWMNATASMPFAHVGRTLATSAWTDVQETPCNTSSLRLYCLQQ